MKKLTLDLDAIRVESFDTDAPAREQGTVRAYALGSGGKTCISCPVPTDPCLCDPFEPLTEAEDCL
jgi:hypothetical protein